MALLQSPQKDNNFYAIDFKLKNIDGRILTLADCRGQQGLLIMFICNHCPYVKAILPRLIEDVRLLQAENIGCVAISSNDPDDYPEDNYENMQIIANRMHFPFPYLFDESQAIAKAYGAVCTPDFFGYNSNLELQYRGRLDESGMRPAPPEAKRELLEALRLIAKTGKGPQMQVPSQGCSIKWRI